MPTDFELLDAWRGGDKDAGNALFERHFDSVCAFFRNKVSRGMDDLIQHTFLACVEHRDTFRKDASFRTFLFTVARSKLYDHLRTVGRERARVDPMEQSAAALAEDPINIVVDKQEQRVLLEALRNIPLEHQVALELYYWEDLSARELSEILETPEGTVRTRIRRAKQLLEEQLEALAASTDVLASTVAGLDDWARSLAGKVSRPADD